MMPSPAIDVRPDNGFSCPPSAGSAHARIGAADSPAVAHSIPSRHTQITRSHQAVRANFAASRSRQPMQSSLSKAEPAAKSP